MRIFKGILAGVIVGGLLLADGPVDDPAWRRIPGPPDRGHRNLPDFTADRDVAAKKTRFFSYLLPLVEAENDRLAAIRGRLRYIYDHVRCHRAVGEGDLRWLHAVSADYRIADVDPARDGFWVDLFARVDLLPVDLVLIQAANESAWGTSRFAREGNNLFGQWCFDDGCGMVPRERPEGASYEVARYASVEESIRSYMHNLNTGRSYRDLRDIRARLRRQGRLPVASLLAGGLESYSERGDQYVQDLRDMIRHNYDLIADLASQATTDGNS